MTWTVTSRTLGEGGLLLETERSPYPLRMLTRITLSSGMKESQGWRISLGDGYASTKTVSLYEVLSQIPHALWPRAVAEHETLVGILRRRVDRFMGKFHPGERPVREHRAAVDELVPALRDFARLRAERAHVEQLLSLYEGY